jgi:hypothetical protein
LRERANEREGYFRKIAIPRSPAIAHAFLYEEKSEKKLHLLLWNGGSKKQGAMPIQEPRVSSPFRLLIVGVT